MWISNVDGVGLDTICMDVQLNLLLMVSVTWSVQDELLEDANRLLVIDTVGSSPFPLLVPHDRLWSQMSARGSK